MRLLTIQCLKDLLGRQEPPCISVYLPTHRHHPDNQQDPIRFKNQVRSVEESLRQKYSVRDVRGLLEPLQSLGDDAHFWNHTRDGLAVLASPGALDLFKLQRRLPELVVVADSFHVKPLLRYVQSADRFHVLALTRDTAEVLEGNRYQLDPESPEGDFPSKAEMVLPEERGERGVSVASSNTGVGGHAVLRGNTEGKTDRDAEKFFRAVDRAVTETYSKPTGLPLVLAALPEHMALFREVSHNPLLLPDGVPGNPKAVDTDRLRQQVWAVLEPHYLARLDRFKEDFQTARSRQQGSADLSDACRAAVEGRVGTLLVEAERVIAGSLDRTTGAIRRTHDLTCPETDDILDDLSELVIGTGGEVVVVPAERMPTTTGLAAIFRY